MNGQTDQGRGSRSVYVMAAWASPLAAAVIAAVFWLWIANHEGMRGERPPAVLLFYVILLSASVVGELAGVFSLFGIRSWRNALSIIPSALLGICGNGFNAFWCLFAYGLEGRNLGG